MDDRLDLMDQGAFLGLRALGHQPFSVHTWVYDRPVNLDAVARFNDRLVDTLLGRLVQRSPLQWGRHRWVAIDAAPPLEIETVPRPREAIHEWTDELAERGADPEHGPGWRLGVLPLADGGTAIALTISHTLGDAMCKFQALGDAARGVSRRPDYRLRSRSRRRDVLVSDLVTFVRELPAVGRAFIAAIRVARSHASVTSTGRALPVAASGQTDGSPFRAAAACVRVPLNDWDVVAARLGGTSHSLFSAFCARLAARMDRTDARGRVTLVVPVSMRCDGDTVANALDSVHVVVDPEGLDADLSPVRTATKAALTQRSAQPDEKLAVLPLVPLTPAVVARKGEQLAIDTSVSPVGCSNHGTLDPDVARVDGADPDDFWVRFSEPGQTAAELDRLGGQLYVMSGRVLGRLYLSVVARPVGGGLDSAELHRLVTATLADFGLAEPQPPMVPAASVGAAGRPLLRSSRRS